MIFTYLRSLPLRIRLWRKNKSDCPECCVFCPYFEGCRSDLDKDIEYSYRGYIVRVNLTRNLVTVYDDMRRTVAHCSFAGIRYIETANEIIDTKADRDFQLLEEDT